MINKKKLLSIITIKTLLIALIFVGVGIIIIVGGLLIGEREVVINDKPIEDRQTEEITLFTGCNDFLDLWSGLSSTEKTKECNKVLDQHTVDLKTMGFAPEYCKVIKAEVEHCKPAMGTRLACSYICEIVDRDCKGLDEKECIENQKCEPNYVYLEDGEKQYVFCEGKIIKPSVNEVSITTDKTEYERGEMVEITVKNNLDGNIYYYENIYCYLEYKKENENWIVSRVINMPCLKGEMKEIKNGETVYFDVDFTQDGFTHYFGSGKYRIAFDYKTDKGMRERGVIYSNEFTIKEKSALDPRCSEKVKGDNGCGAQWFGYEFDQDKEICITKVVVGCSFKTPFKTLKECQEVCEKKENVTFPDKDELIKCENDSDCVLVNSGCCGCSMGGEMTCINKIYLEDWNQKLRLDCKDSFACPAIYLCDDSPTGCKCVNNVCQGAGGDLIKL